MEDTIKKILQIDDNARQYIEEINSRLENTDKYIKQEISIKQTVYDNKRKEEIDQKAQENDRNLRELREQKEKEYQETKQNIEAKFASEKENIKSKIISEIIGEGE